MKKKEEDMSFEEYVKLRETRRVRETKRVIKQNAEDKKKEAKKSNNKEEQEVKNLVKKESNENLIPETLKIAKVLKNNGVNLEKINISRKGRYLTLEEIKQDGINMQKIIEENGLDGKFKFGRGVYTIRCAYKGTEKTEITEEEKTEAEDLSLIERENSIAETLKITKILNGEGVDFSKIQLSKNNKFILLEEIEQDGIDMQKVIKKYKLDGKFKIGKKINYLRESYNHPENYRITEKQRKEIEKLGLLERESAIAETLRIVRILRENGVDITKIKLTKVINGKQEYTLLREIEQDGIDMQKVIEENGLDGDFKIGRRIVNLRTAYNDSGTYIITHEEKKEAEDLGLIPQTLKRKFEQKQTAIDKKRKAKELYDRRMRRDRESLIV